MSVAEEKSRFPSETFAYKAENAFTERKRRSQKRNRVYRAKFSLAKPKTRLPSENVIGKGVLATTERNRVYRAKISLAKAKTPFSS